MAVVCYRHKGALIDGKAMAKEIHAEVKAEVEKWVAAGNRRPHLSAIIVGEDPASHTYVRNKMKATEQTGGSLVQISTLNVNMTGCLRNGQ